MHLGTSFFSQKELKKFNFFSLGKNVLIKKNVGFYFVENICIGNNTRIDDNVIIVASNGKPNTQCFSLDINNKIKKGIKNVIFDATVIPNLINTLSTLLSCEIYAPTFRSTVFDNSFIFKYFI